jgi:hypothetical protein
MTSRTLCSLVKELLSFKNKKQQHGDSSKMFFSLQTDACDILYLTDPIHIDKMRHV